MMAQKTGRVYITTVSLFAAKTSRTTYAVFRKGRAVATLTDDAMVRHCKDAQNSTIEYTRNGLDGHLPAEIGVVQSLATSELTELKAIKPVWPVVAVDDQAKMIYAEPVSVGHLFVIPTSLEPNHEHV